MGRKKDSSWVIWLLLIAIVVTLIVGGANGWFSSVTNLITNNYESKLQQSLENPAPSAQVSFHFSMTTVCAGIDQTTGSITSNMPGATCTIYYTDGSGFKPLEQITLDNSGSWSNTDNFGDSGIFVFKVICMKDGLYATSNEASVTVNDCSSPTPTVVGNCIDSDGGSNILVAGTVALDDGTGQLTAYDVCETANTLTERTCSADKTSYESTILTCPTGYYCFNGACLIGQPACAASCISQVYYDWTTGGCFAPDLTVDASVADTCVRNYGDWTSAYGCESGKVCCCR